MNTYTCMIPPLSLILHRSAYGFASVTLKRHSRKRLGENILVFIRSVYFSQFFYALHEYMSVRTGTAEP